MPYRRGGYRKKSYGRKSYRRGIGYKKVARIAQAVVNKNIETKEITYQYNAVGIDPVIGGAASFASCSYGSGAIVAQLTRGITTGVGDGNRVGNEIELRGVYLNMAIQCASGSESNNFRIIVIRPKGQFSTSSTAALVQSIFNNAGSSSTQWLNPIDTDAFKVYYDRKFWIMPKDINATGNVSEKFVTKFLKFGKRGIKMTWNISNSQPFRDIWVVAISDSTAVSHPGAVAGFIKIYYKDA